MLQNMYNMQTYILISQTAQSQVQKAAKQLSDNAVTCFSHSEKEDMIWILSIFNTPVSYREKAEQSV